jgi:hypothetical protein
MKLRTRFVNKQDLSLTSSLGLQTKLRRKMKLSTKKQWLKVIEFAVVGAATWLDPSAGGLIFLLKLCFDILKKELEKNTHTASNDKDKLHKLILLLQLCLNFLAALQKDDPQ